VECRRQQKRNCRSRPCRRKSKTSALVSWLHRQNRQCLARTRSPLDEDAPTHV